MLGFVAAAIWLPDQIPLLASLVLTVIFGFAGVLFGSKALTKEEAQRIVQDENRAQTEELKGRIKEAVECQEDRSSLRHDEIVRRMDEMQAILCPPKSFEHIRALIGKSQAEVGEAVLEKLKSAYDALIDRRYGDAIGSYLALVSLFPDTGSLHFNLGVAYYVNRQFKEAIREYRSAIDCDGEVREILNNLGTALLADGQDDAAFICLGDLVRRHPDFAPGYVSLGIVHAQRGEIVSAVGSFRKAIEVQPEFAIAHYNLGNAYVCQGRLKEAREEFRTATIQDPRNSPAWSNLGCTLAQGGDTEAGIKAIRIAIELNPRNVYAHFNLGVVFEQAGRRKEAIEEYKLTVEIDPKFAYAHLNLGIQHILDGDRAEAKSAFLVAVREDPDLFPAYHNLAMLALEDGDVPEALSLLSKTLEHMPADQSNLRQVVEREINGICRKPS